MSKQPAGKGKGKTSALKVRKATVSDLSVSKGKAGNVKGGAKTSRGPTCPLPTGPTEGP